MRKLLLSGILLMLVFQVNLFAQTEAEIIMDMFKLEKKAAMADFMALSEGQAITFWELYDAYEIERKDLSKKRISLLNEYADNYSTLNAEKVDKMVNEMINIQKSDLALRTKYYKKIKKSLGAEIAGRFFQAEDAINTIVKSALYDDLPLIPSN
ncbi:hypothetical protein [Marinigracilibium pacificum]|uniref:Uncharacterized protein n=1 Tax=Marinigracilibium pacificum TaxID=2729599 RepID=A0A848J2U8_9BACT|nr:hypothetical protein [Marinigracilibium pacificum]NMM49658.1 hypothetical protein [Marinigracilibium pacificum]